MALICPVTSTSDSQAVASTAAVFSAEMADKGLYLFVCSVAAWIKQGTLAYLETYAELDCATVAMQLDTVIRAESRGAAGNALSVEMFGDSGLGEGVYLDEVDGLLTIHYEDGVSTIGDVETAIDGSAGFRVKTAGTGATVLSGDVFSSVPLEGGGEDDATALVSPIASAADGSMYVPAGSQILIDGSLGNTLSVIRASGDGTASLTRCKVT